jgi:hypothetical protein
MKKVISMNRQCDYGVVGEKTPFRDCDGKELHTGDVVSTRSPKGTDFGNAFIVKYENVYFAMGLRGRFDNESGKIKDWKVRLIKKYYDVEENEVVDGLKMEFLRDEKDEIKEDLNMDCKFKVGDKVRVIKDLIIGKRYDNTDTFVDSMEKYKGEVSEVEAIKENGSYRLKGFSFSWTPSMLEHVIDGLKVGDIVTGRQDGRWLDNRIAEIIKIDSPKNITIKLIDEAGGMKSGDIDSGWEECWLTKVEDYVKLTQADKIEVLYEDRKTTAKTVDGKVGIARCHTEDVFDKAEGARIAIARALGQDPFPKKEEVKLETDRSKLQVGSVIKIREDLMEYKSYGDEDFVSSMNQFKGKTAKIVIINEEGNYKLDVDNGKWTWTSEMFESKEVEEIQVAKPVIAFKVGDTVKLISNNPKYSFGCVNTGDIGKITEIDPSDDIYVDFPNQTNWTGIASEFELVEEAPKTEEFQVGDCISFKLLDGFKVCKIEKIEKDKLWGYFTKDTLESSPSTVIEFESLEKKKDLTYIKNTNKTLKKLVLIDDTQEVKSEQPSINQELWIKFINHEIGVRCETKQEATEFLKHCEDKDIKWTAGAKATHHDYFNVDGVTYWCRNKEKLSYSDTEYLKDITIEYSELLKQTTHTEYNLGDELTYEEAVKFIELGGKVKLKSTAFPFVYYLVDGELKYEDLKNDMVFSSGGYGNLTHDKLTVYELPVETVKEETSPIESKAEVKQDEDFKVGDYIGFKLDGEYYACKIERIENEKAWGFWVNRLKELPKTVTEFESLDKEKVESFVNITDSDNIKLSFQDEVKEEKVMEYKVGQTFETRDEVIAAIKAGCKVLNNKFVYFEKDGALHYDNGIEIKKSSEYDGILNYMDQIEIASLPEPKSIEASTKPQERVYEIGEELSIEEEVKAFIKLGGKVKDREGWKYYINKKGELKYKDLEGEKKLSKGYCYILLPCKVHKLPKTTSEF